MAPTEIEGFTGTVLEPGAPDYDEARTIWNALHDRRPAMIVCPNSPRDVARALEFAQQENLTIAVRCGGHSLPGHSVCDDGLLIDLRNLDKVVVDPDAKRATVEGGAMLGKVDQATQEHGLVVPTGVVSHTGVGGLTLGGGVGRLMRRFGLTIDSLLSAEVVTAGGQILRASEDENPDLFWALRGGGGNFGIVTEFEFALHELSDLVVLAAFHHFEDAPAVLDRGRREMADPEARDELLWTNFLRRGTDAPWMKPEYVGEIGIMSLIEWSGDLEEGEALLTRLREELAPAASMLSVMPFLTMQTMVDELFDHGQRVYAKSGFAADLSDGLIEALLKQAEKLHSPVSQVELLAVGGAISRVDAEATAYPSREPGWLVNIPAIWGDAADDDREIGWVRETFAAIAPFLEEGNYVNFMGADDDLASQAYGRTYRRLQQIKSSYDPDNVFRLNQNIVPAPA